MKKRMLFVMATSVTLICGCQFTQNKPTEARDESKTAYVENKTMGESETESEVSTNRTYHLADADTDIPMDATPTLKVEAKDLGVSEIVRRDLPVLYLNTDDGTGIDSRDLYEGATLTIDNSVGAIVENGTCSRTKLSNAIVATSSEWSQLNVQVRGRGNASWLQFPQKGISLKFEDKVSLFGMNRGKKYALIPTYGDASLIRNVVSTAIIDDLDTFEYVPGQINVELYINGEYRGVYTLSEKVTVASNRVNLFSEYSYEELVASGKNISPFLTRIGVFMNGKRFYDELDYVEGLDYIFPQYSERMFLSYPNATEPYSPEVQEVEAQLDTMGDAIHANKGYEQYIDVEEWVDWFIIMELTGNMDSAMHRSTYFYRKPGGLIQLGPLWDFDQAYGLCTYVNSGKSDIWLTTESSLLAEKKTYMYQLYCDDAFMLRVRARWDEVKDTLMQSLEEAVIHYRKQVSASYEVQNALYGKNASTAESEKIISYAQMRYDWIDRAIHQDGFCRIYDAQASHVIENHNNEVASKESTDEEKEQ